MELDRTILPTKDVPASPRAQARDGLPRTRDEALDLWLATLEGNGVRETTRANYREIIRWLPDVWPLDHWTLLRWWKDLGSAKRKRKVKPITRSLRAIVVRNFCAWAAKTGALDDDPFVRSGIEPPKPPVGEPRTKIFPPELLAKLFRACGKYHWWEKRLYVMMRLDLRSGLRAGEICNLIWEDIEWDRPAPGEVTIRLRKTKGSGIHDKPEYAEIAGETVQELRHWYHTQGHHGQSAPMKYVFPTATWQQQYNKRIPTFTNKPLTPRTYWKALNRLATRVGIGCRITPHMFRHSAATAHYDQFGDLEATRIFMRHKNANTTRLYMDKDKVREHVRELQRKFTLGENL